jgi:phosphoenolpyruvate carboxykinase (ATP)
MDDLKRCGIVDPKGTCYVDESPAFLVEQALERGEGRLLSNGALAVFTGERTGRSARDRFVVDTPDVHDTIAWGSVNRPISEQTWESVKQEVCSYLGERDLFIVHARAGAHPRHTRKFLVVAERASQALFAHQMLIRPDADELAQFGDPDFTVLAAPLLTLDPAKHEGLRSHTAVLINFSARMVLICGTLYSGEIKKSIFSVMNYLMPVEDGVLPMHSSCNKDAESGETAVFFGLSGTGKTTLSADPARSLVGDDEHAWADDGVFNFEGGCYAKTIRIKHETEPQIFDAIRFGAVTENVRYDERTRIPDFDDDALTENTRAAYPIEHIANAAANGRGGVPNVIIMLTADAFGVLPPISRLDENAAMYQFLSGFTSKVAGTEEGIVEPTPTFSALFGEPFMPLDPLVYAEMLGERLRTYGTRVYLVNTGWTGGAYGTGARINLAYTRRMVTAALSGELATARYVHDERFGVDVPQEVEGVPSELLNPRETWADKDAYDAQAEKLARMFQENAAKKYPNMPDAIRAAGPRA